MDLVDGVDLVDTAEAIEQGGLRQAQPPVIAQPPAPVKGSACLELGCGVAPLAGATVHHDRTLHSEHVDIAHDLNVLPWPWADEEFAKVIAIDVFEHIARPIPEWLDECWRILQPGGRLVIQVPASDSWHAWADPTHVRAFHDITFSYWDPATRWYQKYGKQYGFSRLWKVGCERSPGNTEHGVIEDLRFVLTKLDEVGGLLRGGLRQAQPPIEAQPPDAGKVVTNG